MSNQPPTESAPVKPEFETLIPFVQKLIAHRQRSWTLTTLAWEDVSQKVLIRAWKQYPLYDPARGPFENWLNTLISNTIRNILRDELYRYIKPCLRDGGCQHNTGGDSCYYTGKILGKSGIQCAECPLYAEWLKSKRYEYNVKTGLSLDSHAQEVHNKPNHHFDIESAKKVLDAKMLKRLGGWDRRIYRLLFQKHLTPQEASEELKKVAARRKKPLGPDDAVDYQSVLKVQKMLKEAIIQMVKSEDLI